MIIGMGLAVLFAYLWPNVLRDGGVLRAQYSVNYGIVAIIFLISGLSMSSVTLYKMLVRWRAHFIAQSLSFLVTSAFMFGIAEAIRRANNSEIDPYLLVGIVVTGVTPTTVASNVVMTKAAGGNDHLTVIEVTIGNLIGAFVSPALLQMYLTNKTGFGFGNPASGEPLSQLYARVMQNLGCSVFVPLFVGQVVQNVFPKQVKWAVTKLKLGKLGSLCLLILIWSSFSTSFYQHAFTRVSHKAIIMVVFLNVGFYLFFTVLAFCYSRVPYHKMLPKPTESSSKLYRGFYNFIIPFRLDRKDTVAIMLCAAAKTVALGVPLIDSQYGQGSPLIGIVSLPLVLYQGEQILVAQFLVPLFKRWIAAEEPSEKVVDEEALAIENDPDELETEAQSREQELPTETK